MKAIIFDMDGVLFDTERVGDQAWRQAAEEMGFAQIDDAIFRCRGLNRNDTRAFFEKNYPDFDYLAFHKRNHEIMAEMLADGMPIKPGAVELLQWLRQEDWRVALATSTGRESTMHHLESAKMVDLFHAIITGEQVEHGKPDPEIYEIACDAIGADPGLSFAVEDFSAMQSAGYRNCSYVKQFNTESIQSEVHYFMHINLPENQIEPLIQQILADAACGKIYRIKGALPAENGDWLKVNATAEKTEISPVKDGQAVLIAIGDNLHREKIDAYLQKYNTDPEYVSI